MKERLYHYLRGFVLAALSLRYKMRYVGYEEMVELYHKENKGFLFLPNHPALLVDPVININKILRSIYIRPVVVDFMYYIPFLQPLLKEMETVFIPDFFKTTNSHKLYEIDLALDRIVEGLEAKKNYIFYPAGLVKYTAEEQLGGASGLHKILQRTKDIQIILIRTTGLWGSSFSRCHPEIDPYFPKVAWQGVRSTLKNGLFFNPRREVTIEYAKAPDDFPYDADKQTLNRYLEDWYNQEGQFHDPSSPYKEGKEPLSLVPYCTWTRKKPPVPPPKPPTEDELIDLEAISQTIKDRVYAKLSELSSVPVHDLRPEQKIRQDLGLDSLEEAKLAFFLEDLYDLKGILSHDLYSVRRVLGLADHQVKPRVWQESYAFHKPWKTESIKTRVYLPESNSLIEALLKTCDAKRRECAYVDAKEGVKTYKEFKESILLWANYLRKLPGEYVGLLFPSCHFAAVALFATLLAGKTPVMINWTLGARAINRLLEQFPLSLCLSSWAFLNRLSNVHLGNLSPLIFKMEDLREEVGRKERSWAKKQAKKSFSRILEESFPLQRPKREDLALILFTSGSEHVPKAVPLSNSNLLWNLHALSVTEPLFAEDVFLSILPPVHSFGCTVSTLLPLLLGMQTIFHPDPVDGHSVVHHLSHYQATLLAAPPSFMKNILLGDQKEAFSSLRMIILGGEKAPEALFSLGKERGLEGKMIEGYGMTECGPVVAMNRLGQPRVGCGLPLAHVEVEVVDRETFVPLGPDEEGLLLVHGKSVFSGYLDKRQDPFIFLQGRVWYKTGDLGKKDKEGHIFLTGREKRFVKIEGEMVSLPAIEEALLSGKKKHWPSEQRGPILAVVAKEEVASSPRLVLFTSFATTKEEANEVLQQQGISLPAKIHVVQRVSSIPLAGPGKVNYSSMESMLPKA